MRSARIGFVVDNVVMQLQHGRRVSRRVLISSYDPTSTWRTLGTMPATVGFALCPLCCLTFALVF